MRIKTTRLKQLRASLEKTLKLTPEASKVINRTRTIRYALLSDYPSILANKEVSLGLIKEILYLDRKLRLETEGIDEEEKEILSQEFQINELGAEVGLNQDIKKLNNEKTNTN